MIQNSINQMLGTMAVLKKAGEFQKGQQEQTDILKSLKPETQQYVQQNLVEQNGLKPEEAANVGKQFESLLTPEVEKQYQEISKKVAATAEAEARWKKDAQDKVDQAQKLQEHIDSLKNRMQYYAAANRKDDRGFYANRAVRKDIQKFLKEDEEKYGGNK